MECTTTITLTEKEIREILAAALRTDRIKLKVDEDLFYGSKEIYAEVTLSKETFK